MGANHCTRSETRLRDQETEYEATQKRTVRVLQQGVVPGGLAMGTSYSVAALLGSELAGSDSLGAIAAVGLSVGQSLAGIPVAEYAANSVKKSVVGYGHADKTQIGHMIGVLLPGAIVDSADSADALAVAICHAHHVSARQIVEAAQ